MKKAKLNRRRHYELHLTQAKPISLADNATLVKNKERENNMNCYRCTSKDCMNCSLSSEKYSYRYGNYILDTYTPEQPDTSGSDKVTPFSEETEDCLRKLLYTVFDLTPNELLCL